MTKLSDHRVTDAALANTATNLTGYPMGQPRTANQRHKRASATRSAQIASVKASRETRALHKAKA